MSTITAPDTISHYTEYWDNREHAWRACGDHGDGTLADVPSTHEDALREAADAWATYIETWVREGDAAAVYEYEQPAASYRLVWTDNDAEWDDEPLATVEIDVVRDTDTGAVIGYELGAVKLHSA